MKRESSNTIAPSNLTLPILGRDHIQGSSDAEIVLLEYGDYECPYCGQAHYVVKALQERLRHRLCFVYRNFPLVNSHAHALHSAQAAEAAHAQGKFWEMHDALFENQQALDDEDLAQYAAALRLDADRLIHEVLAGAYTARIREDLQAGERADVNGTPTFFVNGMLYEGEPEVERFLEVLSGKSSSNARRK